MLLSRKTGQRLKPVGVMSCTFFNGPFLDGSCHDIGNGRIQFFSSLDGFSKLVIDAFGKVLSHGFVIEYICSEDIHD